MGRKEAVLHYIIISTFVIDIAGAGDMKMDVVCVVCVRYWKARGRCIKQDKIYFCLQGCSIFLVFISGIDGVGN